MTVRKGKASWIGLGGATDYTQLAPSATSWGTDSYNATKL